MKSDGMTIISSIRAKAAMSTAIMCSGLSSTGTKLTKIVFRIESNRLQPLLHRQKAR